MQTFEMTAETFDTYLGGGTHDGTETVPGGVQLALSQFPPDADTMALYHLHQATLADASGHGFDLTPHGGAEPDSQGLLCDPALGRWARTGAAVNLHGHAALTFECWARCDFADPTSVTSNICLAWTVDGTNVLMIGLGAGSPRPQLFCQFFFGGLGGSAHWAMTDAEWAAVRQAAHWSVDVLVANPGGTLTVRLNGAPLAGGSSWTGPLGTVADAPGWIDVGTWLGAFTWKGLVDEVRLSTTRRYTADFAPSRRSSPGAFTSPVFDTARLGARWTGLAHEAEVPEGCTVALLARAADALDASGDVDAPWQPSDEIPVDGRYLQWRTEMMPPPDPPGDATPILQSVAATASDAGANLYHGVGPGPQAIDYATPVARLGPAVAVHAATELAFPAIHWFGLRSTRADGRAAESVTAEVHLELDAAGERVPPRPAPAEALAARPAPAGAVRLTWLAMTDSGEVPAEVFRIYSNGGAGEVDYTTALGEVAAVADGRHYAWMSDPVPGGGGQTFAVRAETAAGGVDADPSEVSVDLDASAPAAPGSVSAEPALSD